MNNLIAALVDSLEQENDSMPEGYDLESTTYTINITVQTLQTDLARANMGDELQYNQIARQPLPGANSEACEPSRIC